MDSEQLPVRPRGSRLIHVVIDTPAGSRNKYKYDSALGMFRVSRVLPAGSVFPYDFGSIPRTRAADGDPLDVLVLGLAPSFPGCLVTVRLVGVLYVEQVEAGRPVSNDRLIGVVETPVNRARVRELRSLHAEELRDIEHFFESYNRRQRRAFRLTGRGNARAAERVLGRAVRAFGRA